MQVLKAFKAGKMASPVSGWLLKKIGTVTADTNVDEVRSRKNSRSTQKSHNAYISPHLRTINTTPTNRCSA